MKLTPSLAVIAGLAAAVNIASAGNITGTVTLKGTPPKEADNTLLMNDPTCSKFHKTMPTSHHYVVGSKGELANVVVMLKGITGKSTGAKAPAAVLDQKDCEYSPTILAVQTGQTVMVKNSDPAPHNVHPLPGTPPNKEDNKLQPAGAGPLNFTFPAAENFLKFKCDIHGWMFAWVTVVDHPYFAVTDKDGKFTIKDVPPGKYTVTALHRKASPTGTDKPVEVAAGDVTVDYTLDVPAAK